MTKKRPRTDQPISASNASSSHKRTSTNATASTTNGESSSTSTSNSKSNGDDKPTNLRDQTSLRYISKRVSKKVERKQTTNYNEVANELVGEASELLDREEVNITPKERKNHEKNIRRRVYDALNVLLATDIITKTKDKDNREKTIHWKGFPTNTRNDLTLLEKEKQEAMMEVEKKKQCLEELLVQNICFRNLDKRNSNQQSQNDLGNRQQQQQQQQQQQPHHPSNDNSLSLEVDKQGNKINGHDSSEKIPLPFIVVNTSEKAVIQCEMNREKTDVMFDFNMPFEINDDNEILKRLGLNKTTHEDLKRMLPPDILHYCEEQHLLKGVLLPMRNENRNNNSSGLPLPPRQQYPLPSNYRPMPPGYSHPHHVHPNYRPPHHPHGHLAPPNHGHSGHPQACPPPPSLNHSGAPPPHHHPRGPPIQQPPLTYRNSVLPPPGSMIHHPNQPPQPAVPPTHVSSSSSIRRDGRW